MNQVLKFNTRSTRLGFTSDLHFNQANPEIAIWDKRGFNSLDTMRDELIYAMQPFDVIIHAGDMTLNTTEEQLVDILNRIPGVIYTLWGNHPNPLWKIYKREVAAKFGEGLEVYPFRWKNLVFMGSQATLEVNKKTIVLNHFPLQIWDGRKHGFWHLMGHSHGSFKPTRPEYPTDFRLDIGWDVHGKILTFDDISGIMAGKSIGETLDHH